MGKSAREVIADQLAISVPNPGRYAGDNPVAAEILASLAAAGFNPPSLAATHAVVPKVPSAAMIEALYSRWLSDIADQSRRGAYRDMLQAASTKEGE